MGRPIFCTWDWVEGMLFDLIFTFEIEGLRGCGALWLWGICYRYSDIGFDVDGCFGWYIKVVWCVVGLISGGYMLYSMVLVWLQC